MLRAAPNIELVDHFERVGVNHGHIVAPQVGHIDAGQIASHDWAELVGAGIAVKVKRVADFKHTRHGSYFDLGCERGRIC